VRVAVIITIVLLFFGALNVVTIRTLLRIHPRRRGAIIAAAVIGNLLWPFVPFLRHSTPLLRFLRAVAAPPWFGWAVFTLLYSVFALLLLLAWLPFRRRRSFAGFAHTPSRLFLGGGILAFAIGCWQCLVPLRVEPVTVHIHNLPAAANGMRIVLLGDLHVGLFTRPSRLQRIFATAAAARPDAVVIAGDLVDDDPYFVPKLLAATTSLPPTLPLLAVLGNHEMYGDPQAVIRRLRGSRIQLLVNEGVPLRGLWIAGLSDFAASLPALQPDVARALARRPAGALPILIAHQPKAFALARASRLPLTLVAHTHGGQCGIRPLGWSVAGIFLPYHMGLYREGASQLYVNTGTGYWVLPFRLGMTPEVTVISLASD
jgi:predicted MPP superfamily phosphohydrolase